MIATQGTSFSRANAMVILESVARPLVSVNIISAITSDAFTYQLNPLPIKEQSQGVKKNIAIVQLADLVALKKNWICGNPIAVVKTNSWSLRQNRTVIIIAKALHSIYHRGS